MEALRIPPDSREPVVVMDGEGSKAKVVDCTAGAERNGVRPGITLSAALVLAPQLQSIQREPAQEHAALL